MAKDIVANNEGKKSKQYKLIKVPNGKSIPKNKGRLYLLGYSFGSDLMSIYMGKAGKKFSKISEFMVMASKANKKKSANLIKY